MLSEVIFYFGFGMLAGPALWLLALLEALDPQLPQLPLWADIVIWIFIVALPLVAAPLLVLLIVNPAPPPAKRQLDRRRTKTWPWRPFIIAEAANYDSAGPAAPNLLVIRGVDDEAALLLSFGSIATAINRFLLRLMQDRVVLGVAMVLIIGAAVISHVISSPPKSLIGIANYIRSVNASLNPVFTKAILVATVILLGIPGLFKCFFGREFLFGAMRCEIATDSAPDSIRARIVTLETPYQPLLSLMIRNATSTPRISKMHHKIYDYPDCVPEVAKWIRDIFPRPSSLG
jgi:hypothetical protein